MGKPITMDQLRQDVGTMVEKITKVIAVFRSCHLRMEEYVCLKVIAMVAEDGEGTIDLMIFDLLSLILSTYCSFRWTISCIRHNLQPLFEVFEHFHQEIFSE